MANTPYTSPQYTFSTKKGMATPVTVYDTSIQDPSGAPPEIIEKFGTVQMGRGVTLLDATLQAASTVFQILERPINDPSSVIKGDKFVPQQLDTSQKYAHTADEIQETDKKHWFTEDERIRLIEVYNKLQTLVGRKCIKVVKWTIQPKVATGKQMLNIHLPFTGNLVSAHCTAELPGDFPMTVKLLRCHRMSYESPTPLWETLTDFETHLVPPSNFDYAKPISGTPIDLHDYLDVLLEGQFNIATFKSNLIVEAAIEVESEV